MSAAGERLRALLELRLRSGDLDDEQYAQAIADVAELEGRAIAPKVIALDTEMERRACNPEDPGDAARWAARWQELVDECRALLQAGP